MQNLILYFPIKAFLLVFLFGLYQLSAWAQPTMLFKSYLRDAVNTRLSNIEIGDKYFCTDVLHRTDHYGDEARRYLEFALSQQRKNLYTEHVNPEEVTFTPYDALPANEIPAKPFHMLSETKNVYVAQYHGKIILYFLLQDDKIASTLLFAQGDEHYFVDLCN